MLFLVALRALTATTTVATTAISSTIPLSLPPPCYESYYGYRRYYLCIDKAARVDDMANFAWL